jgi:hypothetical protein
MRKSRFCFLKVGKKIKNKTKFSSYIRKFWWGSGVKSYMRKSFNIWGNAQIFPYICMTMHPLNFLIIEENFIFFFISAVFPSCYDGKCATQRSQYLPCRIREKKRELLDALNRTHTHAIFKIIDRGHQFPLLAYIQQCTVCTLHIKNFDKTVFTPCKRNVQSNQFAHEK